jgi:hypothetical protein
MEKVFRMKNSACGGMVPGKRAEGLLLLLLVHLVQKSLLPSLPNEENKVDEDEKENAGNQKKVQSEKTHAICACAVHASSVDQNRRGTNTRCYTRTSPDLLRRVREASLI